MIPYIEAVKELESLVKQANGVDKKILELAGLITKALDAKVIIGLGRNEVNPDVLAKPLGEGHSNGEINLWKQGV